MKPRKQRILFFILVFNLVFGFSSVLFAQEEEAPEIKPTVTISPDSVNSKIPAFGAHLKKIILNAETKIRKIDDKMRKEGLGPGNYDKERLSAEYVQMGDLYYSQGKLFDAMTQWQEASRLTTRPELKKSLQRSIDKANVEMERERQVEQAVLPKAEGVEAGSSTEQYLCNEGIALYKKGEFNEALTRFNKALLINPNNKVAKKYVQIIFAKGKDQPEVIDYPVAAMKNTTSLSKSEDYLCSMGVVLYNRGEYKEALEEFNKALLVNPGNSTAKEYIQRINSGNPMPAGKVKSAVPQKNNPFKSLWNFFRDKIGS